MSKGPKAQADSSADKSQLVEAGASVENWAPASAGNDYNSSETQPSEMSAATPLDAQPPKTTQGRPRNLSRRELLYGAAGACALLAVGGGLCLAFGDDVPLRPPGGQNEEQFIARCIKCDRCRSACHLAAIGVASVDDGLLNARTPKMEFRKGYCDFCAEAPGHREVEGADAGLLCVANCPTGALQAFDKETQWISPAIIDSNECVAFKTRGACGICASRCPFDAISLDANLRPVVDESKCNGCGYCEYICPSNSYRSYSGSNKRGINVEWRDGDRL